MTAEEYKPIIIQACKEAGTYQPFFMSVIDTLASILERRDDAQRQYDKAPAPVIAYTNKGGATNPTENPCLTVLDKMEKSALAYWRDLGLTPAGLKRINEKAMQPKKRNALADALRELGEAD